MNAIILLFFALAFGMQKADDDDNTLKGSKASFLEGKWMSTEGRELYVKGEKCIFLKSGNEYEIIEKETSFVLNTYKCDKIQSGSSEIVWTHDAKPDIKWMRLEKHISLRRRLPQVAFHVLEMCSFLSFLGLIGYSFYAISLTATGSFWSKLYLLLCSIVSFFLPSVPMFYQDWMGNRFNLNQRTARILALSLMTVLQFVLLLLDNKNFYYALIDFIPHLATHTIIVLSSVFFNKFSYTKSLADSMTLTMGMIFLTHLMMPKPDVVEKAHFAYVNKIEPQTDVQTFDFSKFWIGKSKVPEETAAGKLMADLKTGATGRENCLTLHGQWVRNNGSRGSNQQIQAMCEKSHPLPFAKFKESLNVPTDAKECDKFFKKLALKVHPDKCGKRCSDDQKGLLELFFKYAEKYHEQMCPKHRNQKTNQ